MEGVARKGCSVLHPHCPVPVLSPLSGGEAGTQVDYAHRFSQIQD